MNRFLFGFAALGGLLAAVPAAAETFAIDLEVRSGKASKTAHIVPAGPGTKAKERDILMVKAGERITVKWKLHSTDAKTTVKDVVVHFFAVQEEKANQQAVPKLNQGVAAECALTMDFGPNDNNEGQLSFTIDKPGYYLFRVETLNAAADPTSADNFAVLDVEVR
jgi:hypothetical protein